MMEKLFTAISVLVSMAVAVIAMVSIAMSDGSFGEKATVFSFIGALVSAGAVFFTVLSFLLFMSALILDEIKEAKKERELEATIKKNMLDLTKEAKK